RRAVLRRLGVDGDVVKKPFENASLDHLARGPADARRLLRDYSVPMVIVIEGIGGPHIRGGEPPILRQLTYVVPVPRRTFTSTVGWDACSSITIPFASLLLPILLASESFPSPTPCLSRCS